MTGDKIVRPLLRWRRAVLTNQFGVAKVAHAPAFRVPGLEAIAMCHEVQLGPVPTPHTPDVPLCRRCVKLLTDRGLWPLDD